MSRIFISGSTDGLGLWAAQTLVKRGHNVSLHARNSQRADDARKACPGAQDVFVADLSSLDATKELAKELNDKGPWDTIIHNAGVWHTPSSAKGPEGFPVLFATNTLAPYVLTCLVRRPKNLVFLSSSMHRSGDPDLRDIQSCTYSDSKLHNTLLAAACARMFPSVRSNSIDPGWVATKMGGSGAPDSVEKAVATYVMLAEGAQDGRQVTGQHWYQSKPRATHPAAHDLAIQEKLLKELESVSGLGLST